MLLYERFFASRCEKINIYVGIRQPSCSAIWES